MLHYSNNEWEEVYKTIFTSEVYSKNQKYIGFKGNFYVSGVYFTNLGNDGVIFLKSNDIKSLISSSSFENSSRDGDGGSIYIKGGQSSIRKACSFGSKSSGDRKFCYISVTDNSTNINELHDSSIAYSNQGALEGYNSIYLRLGNNSIFQNNITRNYCKYNTAFGIDNSHGNSSIKYTQIDENYGIYRICAIGRKYVTYNNIVFTNNTVSKLDTTRPGMFLCYQCHATFENCYIANNNQSKYFMFGIRDSGSITVSNSYIDATENLYRQGQRVSIGPNIEISPELRLLSVEFCPTENFVNFYKIITELIHHNGLGESMTSLFS